MARNAASMPIVSNGGGGLGRRVLSLALVLFVLTMVIRDPAGAAHVVRDGLGFAHDVIGAISTFGAAVSGKG